MAAKSVVVSLLIAVAAWLPAGAQGSRQPDGRAASPEVHPRALRAMDDCTDFRSSLAESYTEMLLQSWYIPWDTPWSSPGGEGGAGDYSTTNVQEAGIDEPDLVKTDGATLFTVVDGSVRVLDVWPPETASMIATADASDAWPQSLLLVGQRLAVFETVNWDQLSDGFQQATRIRILDVSDPTAPVTRRSLTAEGWLVGARLIDDQLYAVFTNWVPTPAGLWDLLWDLGPELPPMPEDPDDLEAVIEQARAILAPHVEAVIDALDLDEVLPLFTDAGPDGAETGAMVACNDILRPETVDQASILTVLHVDLAATDIGITPVTTQTVMASAWTVYASATSLILAKSDPGWWFWWWGPIATHPEPPEVEIHRFALDPGGDAPMAYSATGTAPGRLLDQFCLGEYEGDLRVATGPGWGWDADVRERGSTVSVLRDDGHGTLRIVGQVSGIAPGEDLYASRFMGDRGYLVTFEQIDPLFTLDLAQPTEPEVVGELEMPGFSTYLHPMAGGDQLLAVGRDGTEDGATFGLAIKTFDVANLAKPSILATLTLGHESEGWAWSEALSDHHAFTYHRDLLAIPASHGSWYDEDYFVGLIAIGVAPDGSALTELGRVDHMDLPPNPRNPWPAMRRSLVLDDTLVAVSNRGVTISHVDAPEVRIGLVSFFDEAPGIPPATR
jgi:hypothetical protein